LVKIYAYYAMNLENAINKIHNIEQEDDSGWRKSMPMVIY
jgi:hypothetical protein